MLARAAQRLTIILSLAAALAANRRDAGAQQSILRGLVSDSAGVPIAEADVGIVAQHRLTRTDAQGRFSIDKLAAGTIEVSVRRLGYKPQTQQVVVSELIAYSYEITLIGQPALLAGMDIAEKRRRTGV